MIPAFANQVPLIGSSFDALNSQRFAWQGRNDQTEAANIARFNAAQEQQNRYRFQLAQQEQEAMRQDAIAREAAQRDSINLALSARNERENTRRFDLGLKQAEKHSERQYNFKADQEKAVDTTVENFAKSIKSQAHEVGSATDAALNSLNTVRKRMAETVVETESKLTPGSWVKNRSGEYVLNPKFAQSADYVGKPEKLTPIAEAINQANANLSKLMSEYEATAETYGASANSFDQLRKQAEGYGLAIRKDGKRYVVYNPKSDRTYAPFPDEVVPQAVVGPAVAMPPAAQAPPAFVPQTSGTGTTPPVVAPALPSTPLPIAQPFGRDGGATVIDFSERPVNTKDAYDALPSGARFVWTYADGRVRRGVKP